MSMTSLATSCDKASLAGADPHQLMGNRLHMPVVKIGFARRDGRKDLLDEEAQLGII
jgi:hypothetical protein